MLNRHFYELGLHPVLAYPLSLIAFIGGSLYLFHKTDYAIYIFVLLAIGTLFQFGDIERNEFLKSCFSKKDYRSIRLLENIILTFPFIAFLCYQGQFPGAAAVLASALALAILNLGTKMNHTLWTPFSRQPFEFSVGFRKTIALIVFAYFLLFMALVVPNFNLGVFSMLVIFLVCLSFYSYPEIKYYVWIFSCDSKKFLVEKIKNALFYSTILNAPMIIGLSILAPEKIWIILALHLLGFTYLIAMILAKYSAFPAKLSVPQGILYGLGLWFPPLMLGIIPFFYSQANKRLKEILE